MGRVAWRKQSSSSLGRRSRTDGASFATRRRCISAVHSRPVVLCEAPWPVPIKVQAAAKSRNGHRIVEAVEGDSVGGSCSDRSPFDACLSRD